MAHIINGALTAPTARLDERERRRAERRLARQETRNQHRRVVLACELTSQPDATAQVGDHVWCDNHSDFAPVVKVAVG